MRAELCRHTLRRRKSNLGRNGSWKPTGLVIFLALPKWHKEFDLMDNEDLLDNEISDESLEASAGDEPGLGLMWDASCASTCDGCRSCC
jgi:hypothetical protein